MHSDVEAAGAGLVAISPQQLKYSRQIAKKHDEDNSNPNGDFDTMHIRRGDFLRFQKGIDITATEIYANIRSVIPEGATIYISTDEDDKGWFNPLRKHYHLYFLTDFEHLLVDMPNNQDSKYLGMLEQRVASRGRTFVGTYFSTFTGYINRMRAYHSQLDTTDPGYEQGIIPSYFYAERKVKFAMRQFRSVTWPLWAREFPVAWRDIDHDVE